MGCYFFCLSKRSNQEKETEIETHVFGQPPHKPKISAGMSSSLEGHSATGRNLNARGDTACPRRHRFPGLGAMTRQRHLNAQSYRNRRRCAVGQSHRGFNSGAIAQIVNSNVYLSAPEFRPARWRYSDERYDFGLPSLVTFFGGAKKVTDAFVAQSCCVVSQGIDRFSCQACD
jgi:hypothetical protein